MSTYHRPLPVQQRGSLELDQDDASTGYHAPMEQLSISDEATDGLYGSRNPPRIKRKPLLHLKSTSSTDPDENMMMEHASQTSSRNLLRKATTILPTSQYHWILEILAVSLSISALVAIAVLLPLYNDKPLASWSFRFSFNTVVSILGATSRATLAFAVSACISQGKWNWYRKRDDTIMVFDRFEEASRGPWGSVRLLWWSKLRHWIALGALSTVILVGFEPFLQAIIDFEGEEISFSDPIAKATIGKTDRLDIGSHISISGAAVALTVPDFPGEAITGISMFSQYDFGALAAMWAGFSSLNSAESQNVAFTCPSGNCTWAPYTSLATCSSCSDISKNIVKSTGRANLMKAEDESLTMVNFISSGSIHLIPNMTAGYIKYEIPALGMNISNIDGAAVAALREDNETIVNTELTAKATTQPTETISFRDMKSLIISFAMMESSSDFRESKQAWEDATIVAHECALYFCANVYQTTIKQGALEETILGSYVNRNLDSFLSLNPHESELSKAYNEYTNYTLNYDKSDFNRSDLQLLISPEEYRAATGLNTENSLRFNISQNAAGSITGAFANQFARRPSPLSKKQLVYPPLRRSPQVLQQQPNVITSLGASQNFTAMFEAAAAGLTKYIRDLSLEEEPLEGKTLQWAVHIRVRWGFLSLPMAALLGGCLFCLFSIIETRRLGLPAWRGSSLAGLAHGLDAESRERLRAADGISQMDAHADRVKVRFLDSPMGPELRLSDTRIH
ncbi:hypothetical protein CPAR01_06346 [Colletotrichum paranaense]|uniref:Carboxylic ester hydrolase n=1 Tax=Colletotrichum paranaense TaxID=1914294 RepID=A0ABQ9SLE4_9PEZI|nr:uncharacterized protein CPAR01_06346 [Colletotrichum paranaense]KAK1540357.1 hypothetical protein CPAR01_06346 [Colletotrichum paranaense]